MKSACDSGATCWVSSFCNWPLFLEPEEKWYRTSDHESGQRRFLMQDPDGYLLRFAESLGRRPVQS